MNHPPAISDQQQDNVRATTRAIQPLPHLNLTPAPSPLSKPHLPSSKLQLKEGRVSNAPGPINAGASGGGGGGRKRPAWEQRELFRLPTPPPGADSLLQEALGKRESAVASGAVALLTSCSSPLE